MSDSLMGNLPALSSADRVGGLLSSEPSAGDKLRMEAGLLLSGIGKGVSDRFNEEKQDGFRGVFTEALVAGLYTAGLQAMSKAGGKIGMVANIARLGLGLSIGADLVTRTGLSVKAMNDTLNNPQNYERNKSIIAENLGRGAFDYGVMGLASYGGMKLGNATLGPMFAEGLGGKSISTPISTAGASEGLMTRSLRLLSSTNDVLGVPSLISNVDVLARLKQSDILPDSRPPAPDKNKPYKDFYQELESLSKEKGREILPELRHSPEFKALLGQYDKTGWTEQLSDKMAKMSSDRIAESGSQGTFGTDKHSYADLRSAFEMAGHHGQFDRFVQAVNQKLSAGQSNLHVDIEKDPRGKVWHTGWEIWSGQSEPQTIIQVKGGSIFNGYTPHRSMTFGDRSIYP